MPQHYLPGGYPNPDPYYADALAAEAAEQNEIMDEIEAHESDFDPDIDWDDESGLQPLSASLAEIVADCQARVKQPLLYRAERGRIFEIGPDGQSCAELTMGHALSRHAAWVARAARMTTEHRPRAAENAQAIADEIADAVEAARNFQIGGTAQ